MAFQAEQKIKADILRSLSTEQLFRLLSDSDLNVLMKTLGLLRNLLSTRPVSKITQVSRLATPAYALQNSAHPLCSHQHLPTSVIQKLLLPGRSKQLISRPVTFGGASPYSHLPLHSFTACPVSLSFLHDKCEPALICYFILTWFAGQDGLSHLPKSLISGASASFPLENPSQCHSIDTSLPTFTGLTSEDITVENSGYMSEQERLSRAVGSLSLFSNLP